MRAAVALSALLLSTVPSMGQQASATPPPSIPVDVYFVEESLLCKGPAPFQECESLDGTVEVENLLRKFRDSPRISFEIPGFIRSREASEEFFVAVRDYYEHLAGTGTRAALFVFHFGDLNPRRVALRRDVGGVRGENRATDPGKRFIHWYDGKDIDPDMEAEFTLVVDGVQRRFAFI